TPRTIKKLEACQNNCIRRIYGGPTRFAVNVMLHLTNLRTMQERVATLQAQFIFRARYLPSSTLLSTLMPHLQYSRFKTHWRKFLKTPLYNNALRPVQNQQQSVNFAS
ncbi:hypothetical protein BDF20DRAFT_812511, partial [Mycotypha africana]|uniref:uncharacterized protein n=1 Tax=Mycotypha africana TaxID=64632 RepID=UPI00230120AE